MNEDNIIKHPDSPISRAQARINILQWLYVNDGKYPNKLDWRAEFLGVLDFNIKNIKQDEGSLSKTTDQA